MRKNWKGVAAVFVGRRRRPRCWPAAHGAATLVGRRAGDARRQPRRRRARSGRQQDRHRGRPARPDHHRDARRRTGSRSTDKIADRHHRRRAQGAARRRDRHATPSTPAPRSRSSSRRTSCPLDAVEGRDGELREGQGARRARRTASSWLQPRPANNTWAIAIPKKLADANKLVTLADWAAYINGGKPVKIVASDEFLSAPTRSRRSRRRTASSSSRTRSCRSRAATRR